MATFKAMLDDWTNRGFDPFAAPEETGTAWGRKDGNNTRRSSGCASPPSAWSACRATSRAQRRRRLSGQPPCSPTSTQDSARDPRRAGLRERGLRLQPFRLPLALRRHVESVGRLGGEGQPLLPDDGGIHPADRCTATTASSGSCSSPTRSSGRSSDKETGAPRARVTMKAGDVAPCRPTSATRVSRRSARCCWCGRTVQRDCRSSSPSRQSSDLIPVDI